LADRFVGPAESNSAPDSADRQPPEWFNGGGQECPPLTYCVGLRPMPALAFFGRSRGFYLGSAHGLARGGDGLRSHLMTHRLSQGLNVFQGAGVVR